MRSPGCSAIRPVRRLTCGCQQLTHEHEARVLASRGETDGQRTNVFGQGDRLEARLGSTKLTEAPSQAATVWNCTPTTKLASKKTIRYYKSLGLLQPGERQGNGHHHHAEVEAARLQKIEQRKRLGLSLDDLSLNEISEVIDLYLTDPTGIQPKRKILEVLRQRLAETDGKLDALQQFRADLPGHIARF